MKQALHIFRKDVHQLWLPITIVLLLAIAYAVFDVLRSPLDTPETARINQIASLASLLGTPLVLAWVYLIAVVIYQESLPGDRQFWVTRPYSWKSLLGAKLLFVFAFFSIPLLISDCCILWAQHFPAVTNIPALLFRQLSLIFAFVLPSFVLATITTGLTQFVLAWFLLLLGLFTEAFPLYTFGSLSIGIDAPGASTGGWIDSTLLLAVVAGVIIWQYTKRRTAIARAVLAISVFVVLPALRVPPSSKRPTFIAYSDKIQRKIDPAKLDITYDLGNASSPNRGNPAPPGIVFITLPLQIGKLPPETALLGFAEFRITAPHLRYPERSAHAYCQLQRKHDSYSQIITLGASKFARIKSQPVNLYTTFYLTAITNHPFRFPAQAKTMAIPDVGSCQTYMKFGQMEFGQGPVLLCRAGVYLPESTLVSIEYPGFRSEPLQIGIEYPRFRSESVQIGSFYSDHVPIGGLSPVYKWITYLGSSYNSPVPIGDALLHPGAELVFTPQRPLGYGIKAIEAQNLNLTPYTMTFH